MTIEDKIEAQLGITPNEYISRAFWSYRHMREVVLDMFLEGIDDVDRSDIYVSSFRYPAMDLG